MLKQFDQSSIPKVLWLSDYDNQYQVSSKGDGSGADAHCLDRIAPTLYPVRSDLHRHPRNSLQTKVKWVTCGAGKAGHLGLRETYDKSNLLTFAHSKQLALIGRNPSWHPMRDCVPTARQVPWCPRPTHPFRLMFWSGQHWAFGAVWPT